MQNSIARWWSFSGILLCGAVSAADDTAIAQCAAVDNPAARLACYDAAAGRPAVPAGAAPAPVAPAPAPAAPTVATFGMPQNTEASITAHISGKFNEWERGTQIRLDNGQVWEAMDDKPGLYPNWPENLEITITRGMFGYSMEIKPTGKRIRVKRVL